MTSSSLSGYWWASSNQTHMISGPEPTLAATAAFGRMSSQLSLSTRICTPVASVKRLVLAIHWSSSPCTKGDQRSRRSVAPASGVYFASWAKAGEPRNRLPTTPAAAAADVRMMSRLVNFMLISSFGFLVRLAQSVRFSF